MAFADPQSLTIGGSATSLPRTGSGPGTGSFQTNDGAVSLSIQHTSGRRLRHTVSVQTKKFSSDPLNPSQNVPVSGTVRVIVDAPPQGWTATEQENLAAALAGWLTAGTNANLKRLLGNEN